MISLISHKKLFKKYFIRIFSLTFLISISFTQTIYAENKTAVGKKDLLEEKSDDNPYTIILYQPTYIAPFSYNSSFSQATQADTPDYQGLNNIETQFQFSVKASVFRNLFNYRNSLNLAYTQLSFWQVYTNSPFFRETNYQPEIFLENIFDKKLKAGWYFHSLNLGFIHDSNGRGGNFERSWNRVYTEIIFSNRNWMLSIRPWYIIQGQSLENNRDIAKFLGYERVIIAYKFYNQVLSLQSYNLEHIGSKASFELTWSIPVIKQLRFYVKGFSGYGQSLIDYNHYTNNISVGLALNDWL